MRAIISAALAAAVFAGPPAHAEPDADNLAGPFRFRVGTEATHLRREFWVEASAGSALVRHCRQPVADGVAGERRCEDERRRSVRRRFGWLLGDLTLTAWPHSLGVERYSVREGGVPWAEAPLYP